MEYDRQNVKEFVFQVIMKWWNEKKGRFLLPFVVETCNFQELLQYLRLTVHRILSRQRKREAKPAPQAAAAGGVPFVRDSGSDTSALNRKLAARETAMPQPEPTGTDDAMAIVSVIGSNTSDPDEKPYVAGVDISFL
jgi:hypothetical protein